MTGKLKSAKASRKRKGCPWSVAEVRQLGRVLDSVLAQRTGRTIKEVEAEREARGIGLSLGRRPWMAREISVLGMMTDRDAGQDVRRSRSAARRQRKLLNIPAFKPRAKFDYWSRGELRLLGTMPDKELVPKLKRTVSSIKHKRWRKDIPDFDPPFRKWTAAEGKLLGTAPDEEIARRINRKPTAVETRRKKLRILNAVGPGRRPWTREEEALLGTAPDEEIARRINCGLAAVKTRREKFHLKLQPSARADFWTPEEDALLGIASDEEIARRINRNPTAVTGRRQKLHTKTHPSGQSPNAGRALDAGGRRPFGHRARPGRLPGSWAGQHGRSRASGACWAGIARATSTAHTRRRKTGFWERCRMRIWPKNADTQSIASEDAEARLDSQNSIRSKSLGRPKRGPAWENSVTTKWPPASTALGKQSFTSGKNWALPPSVLWI